MTGEKKKGAVAQPPPPAPLPSRRLRRQSAAVVDQPPSTSLLCPQCPPHVREEIRDFMLRKEAEKKESQMQSLPNLDDYSYGEDEVDEELKFNGKRTFSSSGSGTGGSKQDSSGSRPSQSSHKQPKTIGPLNTFFKSVLKESSKEKRKQQTINEVCRKDFRDRACTALAR
ncbi:hypothetical protein Dimus_032278 [Dionaea muscipula]